MDLKTVEFVAGEDVGKGFAAALANGRTGALVASASGSLASAVVDGSDVAARGDTFTGPYRIMALSAAPSSDTKSGPATPRVVLLSSGGQVVGGCLGPGSTVAAGSQVSVVLAIPQSKSETQSKTSSTPLSPPSTTSGQTPPPPPMIAGTNIPPPPGLTNGTQPPVPPPPAMGGGGSLGVPMPPPVGGAPGQSTISAPPAMKATPKSFIDQVRAYVATDDKAQMKAARKKKEVPPWKKQLMKRKKGGSKTSKRGGKGKTGSQDLLADVLDTKLDTDKLFYEFRRLLLKNPMPKASEEWLPPSLVTAIRASDKLTGSGYITTEALKALVEKWVLEQPSDFQIRFFARHMVNFVIEKFLNRYLKVGIEHLVMDPAELRMQQTVDKYREGVASRIYLLEKETSLADVVKSVADPSQTVLGFDFDQTITLVDRKARAGIKGKRSLQLRGGEASKRALLSLVDAGAKCCIVTAQTPSPEVAISLVQEVRHLGLARVFDVEAFDPAPIARLIASWGDNETMPIEQLTVKLVVLVALNTDRTPGDLERLGYSQMRFEGFSDDKDGKVAADKGKKEQAENARPRAIFRLFGNVTDNPSMKGSWSAFHTLTGMASPNASPGATSPTLPASQPGLKKQPSLEQVGGGTTMCAVRCMYAYYRRTRDLRSQVRRQMNAPEIPKIFIDDIVRKREAEKAARIAAGDKSLLPPADETEAERKARCDKEDAQRYAEEATRQKEVEAVNHPSNRLMLRADGTGTLDKKTMENMAFQVLKDAKVPKKQWDEALGNPVQIIDLPDSKVQYARYGNCMAARYNKPEALIDFINRDRPGATRAVFVDDNTDNCWNMFANFANKERIGEALLPADEKEVFVRNSTTPVHVYWYKPVKKMEKYNVQFFKLLEAINVQSLAQDAAAAGAKADAKAQIDTGANNGSQKGSPDTNEEC